MTTTVARLSVGDLAERLGIHPATAEMMLDPGIGIIEEPTEEAIQEYLATQKLVSPQEAREMIDRATNNLVTAWQGFLDLELLMLEFPPIPMPQMCEIGRDWRWHMHWLIETVGQIIAQHRQFIEDIRKRTIALQGQVETGPLSMTE